MGNKIHETLILTWCCTNNVFITDILKTKEKFKNYIIKTIYHRQRKLNESMLIFQRLYTPHNYLYTNNDFYVVKFAKPSSIRF